MLTNAGVHGFGAHSTRSVLTSAALEAGLSVKNIMRVADGSNASTLNKFYGRGLVYRFFGELVLQTNTK